MYRAGLTVALLGFSTAIGQIVLMRELIVVFNGNEISVGIMLGTWLLWTAAGSALANLIALGQRGGGRAVGILECSLALSLPLTIWAVRGSRTLFQTVPGELLGPVLMLLTCVICLSMFCFFSGALFVAATRMYGQQGLSPGIASSSAYLFESAGFALGGIVASVGLLHFLDSFQIAGIVIFLNVWMAMTLLVERGRKQRIAAAAIALVLGITFFAYVGPQLRRSSQARLWRGFQLLESRDSIYGNLAVTETGNIRSLYDNGVILANAPDEATAEEAVHYALLEHTAPRRVLLIGGGANGSIAQILRHPTIERVDYIELDPMLISMARQFFPVQFAPSAADERVHIHYADGRLYLRTIREQFEVIILALPDPQTAQLNRFYTAEFFRSAREHLAPGGIVSLQLRASEEYISPERAEFLRCMYLTLREVFPYVSFIPGESMHFLGAMRPDVLTNNPQILIARLRTRNVQTRYVREYFIPFRMMPDRMAQIHDLLQPLPETPINRDFEPIAYYFDVVLWSAQFKGAYTQGFRAAANVPFGHVVETTIAVLLFIAVVLTYMPRKHRAGGTALNCVAATGFTLMVLQLFLLLAFQALYGYAYHQFAILVGMFMAGIALGSRLGITSMWEEDERLLIRLATATQFILAVSGLGLLAVVNLMSRVSTATGTGLVTQFAFPALAIISGMLGGFQFTICTRIYLSGNKRCGIGLLYAIDLLGGCLGALLLSGYLIPVFGFWKTAWLSGAVNLVPALLAARAGLASRTTPA